MDLSAAEQARLVRPVEAGELSADQQSRPEQPIRVARAPRNGLALSLERRRLQMYLALIVSDSAILLGSFALLSAVYLPRIQLGVAMEPGYLLLPLFQTIALYSGIYSRDGLINWREAAKRCVGALLVATMLLSFLAFLMKTSEDYSRVVFAASVVLSAVAMAGVRHVVAGITKYLWGPSMTNRLLIDAGGPVVRIPHVYRVSSLEHTLSPDLEDPVMLDRLSRYLRNMDQVIVSCQPQDRVAWAEVLKGSGIHGEVISEYAREIGALGIIQHREANVYGLLVSTGQLSLRARAMKRVFDLGASAAGLLMLAPVLLLCALAIKLDDGGPVFFRQRRMGRGNTFFDIYKFRSMGEARADAAGSRSASRDDDRVTCVGRLLRRTSLDELPQLINVLLGDMSTIGHRLPAAQPCHAGGGRSDDRVPAAGSPRTGEGRMISRFALWSGLALTAALVVVVQSDRQAARDLSATVVVPPFARVVAAQTQVETNITLVAVTGQDVRITRQLVRRRPVPARNLLLHAQAAQAAGVATQVLPPLEIAATRGWREPLLQALAGRAALAGGDHAAAANRAAALMATGRAPQEAVYLLGQLMQSEPGRAELAGLLGRPGHYSRNLWPHYAQAGSLNQLVEVARLAREQGIEPDCEAITAVAAVLQRNGAGDGAAALLAADCPDA